MDVLLGQTGTPPRRPWADTWWELHPLLCKMGSLRCVRTQREHAAAPAHTGGSHVGGCGRAGRQGPRAKDSQFDQERVVDFLQHRLLIVDMLLLLQADDVGDGHHLQGEEMLACLLLDELHAAERPCTCMRRAEWGRGVLSNHGSPHPPGISDNVAGQTTPFPTR